MADDTVTRWRHNVRGTEYDCIGTAELQDATGGGVEEGALLAIYRGDDGKLWARRESEFGDGRFTRLASPAPDAGLVEADSGMSGDVVDRAELVWTNLPTGRRWTSLATHEKALACHILASLSQGRDGRVEALKQRLRGKDGDEYTDRGMEDAFFRWPEIERELAAALREASR